MFTTAVLYLTVLFGGFIIGYGIPFIIGGGSGFKEKRSIKY